MTNAKGLPRRTFLRHTAGTMTGAVALAGSARSYGRILGANDRISLGHVGLGTRGRGLEITLSRLKDKSNVETTALCDLWSVHREGAVALAEKTYGRTPRAFRNLDDMLALKDVDAVVVSTPEHQHSPMLKMVVEAGKHCYVEKPMGNVLEEAKAARDAALSRKNLIVQVGTQRRSHPHHQAARDQVRTGATGDISKVEIVWNYNGPRWRGRPEVKQIRERDTDWPRWLMTKPQRPFDPQLYFEFRLYREFSSGIACQWMSHGIDFAHWIMDDYFPTSATANGGVFAWHDGRENPDTFQALLTYPKGFLVSYSTSLGNDSDSFMRFMGKKGTMINYRRAAGPRWKWIEERGNTEDGGEFKREERWLTLAGESAPPSESKDFDDDSAHMANWLAAMRAGRQPAVPVQAGFAHSVACIMATRAYREGKRLYWNARNESITDRPPSG